MLWHIRYLEIDIIEKTYHQKEKRKSVVGNLQYYMLLFLCWYLIATIFELNNIHIFVIFQSTMLKIDDDTKLNIVQFFSFFLLFLHKVIYELFLNCHLSLGLLEKIKMQQIWTKLSSDNIVIKTIYLYLFTLTKATWNPRITSILYRFPWNLGI